MSAAPGAGQRLPPADLTRRLGALENLSVEALRAEWRRLHQTPAPSCYSRDLLLRGISFRLQQAVLGGLPPAVQRLLSPSPAPGGRATPARTRAAAPPVRLKPGSTLVRAWHGETHSVLVLEDGFEHRGRRYASLSQIAREVTGAHWSGPRFFGLRRASRATAGEDVAAAACATATAPAPAPTPAPAVPTATAPETRTTEEGSDA